jgi:two-component system osmolarity sensor histidine kinase EnvZ
MIQRLLSFRRPRMLGYATLLIVCLAAVQLISSILFFGIIDRDTIHEDHARRVAELLVAGDRIHQLYGPDAVQLMRAKHLNVGISASPMFPRRALNSGITSLKDRIVAWEPSLASRDFALGIHRNENGQADLVGSMQLHDGHWLNFRSDDVSSSWPIALRGMAVTAAIAILCILLGLYLLRRLGKPLEELVQAVASRSGDATAVFPEQGASDVRALARSVNDMQSRITTLVSSQAQTFEAISHDLRTPLSRLKVAADFVAEGDIAQVVRSSTDEMEDLLLSLQRFLRAQHMASEPETLDLAIELQSIVSTFSDRVTVRTASAEADAFTYREPLHLILQPLIENAVQYGKRAEVDLARSAAGWVITITDDGPGIPAAYHARILDPFFRLDEARARNTRGFGLGIPTAAQILQRFGGALSFSCC